MDDVELLSRLVEFDTVSHRSNLALVDFLCEYAEGARNERVPSPDGRKANLVLRYGPDEGEGLVLCGHMDVVPAEEHGWRSDPFKLRAEGDRLFARGACDMKGFLAVALNVARESRGLRGPLVLVFTYDEETGTVGARDLVERWAVDTLPRRAIIGEPTELRVVRMHKGHVRIRVTMHGVSAHSALPHLGRNAIEAAARVLVSLRGLRHRFEEARGPNAAEFPEAPFVTLNVGTIRGGVAANVVPDRCVMEVGVRPLPGMDPLATVGEVRAAVGNAAGDAPWELDVLGESPPLLLDEASRLHRDLCSVAGAPGFPCTVPFATDGGWLAQAGLECAVYGPGNIAVAHKPNEFITRQDLKACREVLGTLLR